MATILLSIKPEYANKIFDGQKHYEYRKRIPKKTRYQRLLCIPLLQNKLLLARLKL
ncbi:MAG: ASCH domain-containing protein [Oscillospiraceae bacterium]